jgi:predicted transcriptional regulator
MSQKESALEAIRRLLDESKFDDAIEEIRILKRIEEGERAADEGRVRPHSDVRALVRSWAGK